MSTTFDPGPQLEGLRALLDQWTVAARVAEHAARAQQADATLDLLHAARQLGAGAEAAASLQREHHEVAQCLQVAVAAASESVDRFRTQVTEWRRLVDSARRLADGAGLTGGDPVAARARCQRAESHLAGAEADLARALALRARAEATRDRAALAAAEVERLVGSCSSLRRSTESALESLTAAGDELATTRALYDHARLTSLDLRREVLAPPTGEPLPPPVATAWPAPIVAP